MNKRRRYVPNLINDMAECDANYIRLQQLFPHMGEAEYLEFAIDISSRSSQRSSEQGAISNALDSQDSAAKVVISVKERCPYTTILMLKVTNSEYTPWIKWPTMQVRVYHDTKSAEVISFERHRKFKFRYATPNVDMHQADEKSQINKFFGELLSYCSEHGRSLETVSFAGS